MDVDAIADARAALRSIARARAAVRETRERMRTRASGIGDDRRATREARARAVVDATTRARDAVRAEREAARGAIAREREGLATAAERARATARALSGALEEIRARGGVGEMVERVMGDGRDARERVRAGAVDVKTRAEDAREALDAAAARARGTRGERDEAGELESAIAEDVRDAFDALREIHARARERTGRRIKDCAERVRAL